MTPCEGHIFKIMLNLYHLRDYFFKRRQKIPCEGLPEVKKDTIKGGMSRQLYGSTHYMQKSVGYYLNRINIYIDKMKFGQPLWVKPLSHYSIFDILGPTLQPGHATLKYPAFRLIGWQLCIHFFLISNLSQPQPSMLLKFSFVLHC